MLVAECLTGASDGIFWVALITTLADERRFGLLIGLAVVARLGPRALLSMPTGQLVDRLDLRIMLVTIDFVRGALMLVVGLGVGWGAGPAPIIGLMLLSYVAGVPTRLGYVSALPHLVGEGDLASANTMLSTVRQVMTFVGPLLGVGVVSLSPEFGFVVSGALFAAAGATVGSISAERWPARRARVADAAPRAGRVVGAPAIRGVDGLPNLLALVGTMYWMRGMELVLHVLVVRELLEVDATAIGYLGGAIGFGAVAVVPLAHRAVDRPDVIRPVVLAVVLTAVPTVALIGVRHVGAAAALLFFVGAGMVVFEVVSVVTVQRTVDRDRYGKAFGVVNSVANTGKLLGAVAAPVLVELIGLRAVLVGTGALLAVQVGVSIPALARLGRASHTRRDRLRPIVDVLGRLDLFDGTPRAALERLADHVVPEEVATGSVVISEGSTPDDLFVVRTGEFTVSVRGDTINDMAAGDWFGEIGLVEGTPRTATVTANSPSEVWRIPGPMFLAVLEDSGSPPSALVEGIADRLATGSAL